jgi:hypothetical protein
VYLPHLIGVARVAFSDAKAKVDTTQELTFLTPVSDQAIPVRWEDASEAGFTASDLGKDSTAGAQFGPLPQAAAKPKSYVTWQKDFATWVYGSQRLTLWRSPGLKQLSQPGETERDFRVRLQQAAREQRDRTVEALREKFAPESFAPGTVGTAQQPSIETEQAGSRRRRRRSIRRDATRPPSGGGPSKPRRWGGLRPPPAGQPLDEGARRHRAARKPSQLYRNCVLGGVSSVTAALDGDGSPAEELKAPPPAEE